MADQSVIKVDTKGISKPLAKLIEAVRAACGTLYTPYRIRREAKANAEAILILAESENEVTLMKQATEIKLIENREAFLADRRGRNIREIINKSAQLLPPEVSDDPPDTDWLVRLFNDFQDISDSDMQTLWAKILAGEIVKKGSFSLRTIATVSQLTKEEAAIFTSTAQYFVEIAGVHWFFYAFNNHSPYSSYISDLNLGKEFITLEDAGLVNAHPGMFRWEGQLSTSISYHDEQIQFTVPKPKGDRSFMVEPKLLTTSGSELLKISDCTKNTEFWTHLKQAAGKT